MSIQSEIAKIGESPAFVIAMAHAWFACSVMLILDHWGVSVFVSAPLCVALAAAKEFWFDLHYEKTPPQTVWMSASDFSEYLAGIVLASAILLL